MVENGNSLGAPPNPNLSSSHSLGGTNKGLNLQPNQYGSRRTRLTQIFAPKEGWREEPLFSLEARPRANRPTSYFQVIQSIIVRWSTEEAQEHS
jgi:hypothetical protein